MRKGGSEFLFVCGACVLVTCNVENIMLYTIKSIIEMYEQSMDLLDLILSFNRGVRKEKHC